MPSRATCALLAGLLVAGAVGVWTARAYGTSTKMSLFELRPLLSYLLIFPIVASTRTIDRLRRGAMIVVAAGAIAAVETVWQYVHGEGNPALFASGAIRVQDTVEEYQIAGIIVGLVLLGVMRHGRGRFGVGALVTINSVGLAFTFQRGAWLAVLAGAPAALLAVSPQIRRLVARWVVAIVVSALLGLIFLNGLSSHRVGNPVSAAESLLSLQKVSTDPSNQYRVAEWTAAVTEARRHPVLGIGLGSSVCFQSPVFNSVYQSTGVGFCQYYIHNSYVWFWLKLGILGLAAMLLLAVVTLRHGWQAARCGSSQGRILGAAAFGAFVAILVNSVGGPHLNTDAATPAAAAMIGAIEFLRSHGKSEVA